MKNFGYVVAFFSLHFHDDTQLAIGTSHLEHRPAYRNRVMTKKFKIFCARTYQQVSTCKAPSSHR